MKTSNSLRPSRFHFPRFFVPDKTIHIIGIVLIVGLMGVSAFLFQQQQVERTQLVGEQNRILSEKEKLDDQLNDISGQLVVTASELKTVQAEDQRVKNKELEADIKNIQTTYQQAVKSYESVLDLRDDGAKVQPLEVKFSLALTMLAKRNYSSASATLQKLNQDVQALRTQLASAAAPSVDNLKASNTPPASGYSRQAVSTDVGTFAVDILGADLGSTRVVVETASNGDCGDGCPVAALGDYVGRSGGFAGINGPYFCPAEYPSCAGKTNSFDTLLMNKNKVYFNSDNNVYSSVPAFIFSGGGARLVGRSSEWGRDTGVDSVIASQPMLMSGGNVAFGGDGDPKKGSRGSRSFIASKGNQVFIGVVRGATVAEVARVLKVLGMDSALNLDSGGSTAFYVNGKYVAGPGRQTPFGIVLVRK